MTVFRFILALLLVAFAAATVFFAGFAYQTFTLTPEEGKVDAVVVLAGGKGRIDEGIRLYRSGGGEALFLVGVDPAVRKGDLVKERSGERIYLENVSRDTYENAIYARELMSRHGVRSLRLITSRYHMKRALLIFRYILPRDVAIHPHPVDTGGVREDWWAHRASFRLLFSEFYKYYLYRLFFLAGFREPQGGTFTY